MPGWHLYGPSIYIRGGGRGRPRARVYPPGRPPSATAHAPNIRKPPSWPTTAPLILPEPSAIETAQPTPAAPDSVPYIVRKPRSRFTAVIRAVRPDAAPLMRRCPMSTLTDGGKLMVSAVPYPHVTKQMLRGRRHFNHLVELIFIGCLVVVMHQFALVVMFWVYALGVPLRYAIVRGLRRQSRNLDELAHQ